MLIGPEWQEELGLILLSHIEALQVDMEGLGLGDHIMQPNSVSQPTGKLGLNHHGFLWYMWEMISS